MILTTKHLAVMRAALEYWDNEMSPHDPAIYTAYFDQPIGTGDWVLEAVAFLKGQLPLCEMRYALVEGEGLTVLSPQLFEAPEEAQGAMFDPTHQIGTLLIVPSPN